MHTPEFPATAFQITDDDAVKMLLTKWGILQVLGNDRFKPRETFLGTSFREHPTHWIFACRWRDYPDPADNGYSLFGIPKASMNLLQFCKFISEIIRDINPENSGVRMTPVCTTEN